MVDKPLVRARTIFGSALALCVACSSQVVPLNKGDHGQKSDGGGAGKAEQSDGGGAGGASAGDSGTGTGGSTATNPSGGGTGGGNALPNAPSTLKSSHKLDLLLMIDNSLSMADKQQVLAKSVPDLVQRITASSSGITDVHVGVISSSVGTSGSALCAGNDSDPVQQQLNDHGYLIGERSRYADPPGGYPADPKGFLDWNPAANAGETTDAFTTTFAAMTMAVGEQGCGLESQLEAVQRFLVDPMPYETIRTTDCPGLPGEQCAVKAGVDQNLLAQRAAFLRPDSTVAVIVLSDENDCSIQQEGQYYYAAQSNLLLPRGSSACETNPNDKCCYSCADTPPAGCAADPKCQPPTDLSAHDDPLNLRCFHEKQRFGFDFLYPVQRYVTALTSTHLCTSRADLVPDAESCLDKDGDNQPDIFDNPLFVNGDTVRDPSMVYFLSIVGVPNQDIAAPNSSTLVYQTPDQLQANHVWDKILGNANPGNNAAPIDPTDSLMIESADPRSGQDGENPPMALAPPSAGPMANPVNGHEWVNSDGTDLQYSCIFPLPKTKDCAQILTETPEPGCDCKPGTEIDENPLCQTPSGGYGAVQYYAKAYPGLRELAVSQALGSQGLVGSICASNLSDMTQADYGYRPAVDLLLNQIQASAK